MENGYVLENKLDITHDIMMIRYGIMAIFSNFDCHSDTDIMNLFKYDFEAFIGCANLCQKMPAVYKLAGSLNKLLQSNGIEFPVLNTKPIIAFSSKNTAKTEHYHKLGAHQDWHSNLGSINGITCWIPLQDIDDDIGPLEVVCDSHKFGPLEHTGTPPLLVDNDGFEYTPIPMKLGEVLLFNTMLIHRSGENRTHDKIRMSLHLRYSDANEPTFITRKYPRNRTSD